MIKVIVKRDKDKIKEIEMNGHAMYDDYGKDIVCAGVSATLITTCNALLSFDANSCYYDYNKSILVVKKWDNITNVLLNNMLNIFSEMSDKYPKNILVREESYHVKNEY